MPRLAKSLVALSLALSLSLPAAADPGNGRYGDRQGPVVQSQQSDPNRELDALAADLAEIKSLALRARDYDLRLKLISQVERAESRLTRARRSLRMEDRKDRQQSRNFFDYDDVRQVLDQQRFESDKLETLNRMAPNARLTTDEVAQLVRSLTWDSSKQRALVALYPATIDQGRYVLALNALDWDSSRRQVMHQLGL